MRCSAAFATAIVVGTLVPPAAAAEPADLAGVVATHNKERTLVGVPPLAWSAEQAEQAQAWADKLAESCTIRHRYPGAAGQNILVMSGDVLPPPRIAIRSWASERQYYDDRKGRCVAGRDCSHYTQLVWRGSRSVGCALAPCRRGGAVLVCEYDPAGNVVGHRPY